MFVWSNKMNIYKLLFIVTITPTLVTAWGDSKKVKLEDIKTLTLYHGKMTSGRRSSPVPQIQCVGGTAGCKAFVPQVVQCYNRGSDGYDVQWECKTDMDNSYRFGRIDVICEGYDYPDDPYVLKGSCGLEYTIDLTEEGIKKKGGHNYYSTDFGSVHHGTPKSSRSKLGDLIMIAVILLLIYAIYRTCLNQRQYSPTGDDFDHPDTHFRAGFGYPSGSPPPPGFRTDYGSDGSCGATNMGYGRPRGSNNFWTGAMTGGILGYMFGSRNSGYQAYNAPPPMTHRSSDSYSSGSGFASSSGTRTASGFGGTRRR